VGEREDAAIPVAGKKAMPRRRGREVVSEARAREQIVAGRRAVERAGRFLAAFPCYKTDPFSCSVSPA